MQIHILTAEHVPGLITEAHVDPSTATLKAVELVNIMLKDSNRKPTATAKNWREKVEWLQDYHGAAHCYVEIVEHELIGADVDSSNDTVDALERAESFISGFEDDETQEGIAEILAGLRTAIQRERARPDVMPELLSFVRRTAKRDPVFAKGFEKQEIKDAIALVAKAEGRANG